jgi:hypothetical protein
MPSKGASFQLGHYLHDRYVGQPMFPASQNPVHYFTDVAS